MRLRRLAFVSFALLAVPASAPAGPITFHYSTAFTATPSPLNTHNPGELSHSLTPEGSASFDVNTGGTIMLGTLVFGPSNRPQPPGWGTAGISFSASVTITDIASGQTGTLTLPGEAVDMWSFREWDGRATNDYHELEFGDFMGRHNDAVQMQIGNTRYTFSVQTGDLDESAFYQLSAAYATPEPGTFALAAIGLVPLGLRKLRRGAKHPAPTAPNAP